MDFQQQETMSRGNYLEQVSWSQIWSPFGCENMASDLRLFHVIATVTVEFDCIWP